MFEADFGRTERLALLDSGSSKRVEFARSSLTWAREHGHDTIVWHFASKDSLAHLGHDGALKRTAVQLRKTNKAHIGGIDVLLATRRRSPSVASFDLPAAVWWASDDQLFSLDSTHRSLLYALVSATHRAPIWLTAFRVELGTEVGVRDPESGIAGAETRLVPIDVSDTLQTIVKSHSRGMTLSTNGIHDSLAPPLVSQLRSMIGRGEASPEAAAVAALQAGWWPQHIPGLLDKLSIGR